MLDAVVRQTMEDLSSHLQEQVDILRTSGEAFDRGAIPMAKVLAAHIRVLVHDTRSSTSLLKELTVKGQIKYFDTARPIDPSNLLPTPNLVMVRMTSGSTPGYIASKEGGPIEQVSLAEFEDWWRTPIIEDDQGNVFTRRDLVLALAHQEGGAHVDPELPEAYAALSRSNSLGWIVGEGVLTVGSAPGPGLRHIAGNPVVFAVRQIAHELEYSIRFGLACVFPPRFEGQ